MTKDDLSEKTGLSVSTITQLELGGRNLSLRSLYLLMTAFQCDANTILNIERRADGQNSVDEKLEKLPEELKEVYQQFFLQILNHYKEVRTEINPMDVSGYHLRAVSDFMPEDIQTIPKSAVRGTIGLLKGIQR